MLTLFFSMQELFSPENEKIFSSPKYHGIMYWDGEREYRSKRDPTIETVIEGQVWEVSGNLEIKMIRPRPGKYGYRNPLSQLRRLPPFLMVKDLVMKQVPKLLPVLIDKGIRATQKKVGSKIFIIDSDYLYLIVENGKPLDLVGGASEIGETPDDTIKREYWEEVGEELDLSRVLYVGVTSTHSESTDWISHVYLMWKTCKAPLRPIPLSQEIYKMLPSHCAPWLRRHYEFMLQKIGGGYSWESSLIVSQKKDPCEVLCVSKRLSFFSTKAYNMQFLQKLVERDRFLSLDSTLLAFEQLAQKLKFPYSTQSMIDQNVLIIDNNRIVGSLHPKFVLGDIYQKFLKGDNSFYNDKFFSVISHLNDGTPNSLRYVTYQESLRIYLYQRKVSREDVLRWSSPWGMDDRIVISYLSPYLLKGNNVPPIFGWG